MNGLDDFIQGWIDGVNASLIQRRRYPMNPRVADDIISQVPTMLEVINAVLWLMEQHDETERYGGHPWGDVPVFALRRKIEEIVQGSGVGHD